MSTYTDIVAMVPVPFNRRDYDRFGIDTFKARGYRVHVLDVSHVSKTRHSQHVEDRFDDIEVCSPKTEEDLFAYVQQHRTALFLDFCDLHSPVFAAVRKPCAALNVDNLLIVVNDIPGSEIMKYQTDDGYHPKYIVIGSAYSLIRIPPYGPDTKFIMAHAMDYDHYLDFRKAHEEVIIDTTAVFLDQYMPFHPDNEEFKNPTIDPDHYYGLLRNFFGLLEASLGGQVVIAAHPRSQYHKHPDYFGGRPVIHGDTIGQVARSRLVLTHGSTATNYAVLLLKPILLLTTDALNRTSNYFYFPRYERELNITTLNLDHLPAGGVHAAVSQEHYWFFREKFIKIRNTPERFFWDIVADAL